MKSTKGELPYRAAAARLIGLVMAARRRNRFYWRRYGKAAYENQVSDNCYHYHPWVSRLAEWVLDQSEDRKGMGEVGRSFTHQTGFVSAMISLCADKWDGRTADEFPRLWTHVPEGRVLAALSSMVIFGHHP